MKYSYYGCGWSVRPVGKDGKANYWHTGSLPGTYTLLVRRWDGLSWAILFNQRSDDKKRPDSAIDGALHRAADAVAEWPKEDLFPNTGSSRGHEAYDSFLVTRNESLVTSATTGRFGFPACDSNDHNYPRAQMKSLDSATLELLWHDADAREVRLRQIIAERLASTPPPTLDDQIVATYFFALRSWSLEQAAKEISYHATSGTKDIPPGSLLAQCTGKAVGTEAFDTTGRLGLVHMAYPLKMLLQPDGRLTSIDILHTVAGAIIFDIYENRDVRLVALQIPEKVVRTFPGPAHGPLGLRKLTGFSATEPAFGTILKPTAGITPDQVGALIQEAAACPLFLFIKEDENLYPRLDYSPVRERARRAVEATKRVQDKRGGKGLVFAPHITGAPHEILESVHAVVEAGANGVMFSESFAGGTVRMVREAIKHLPQPPAIYGHNAGIGVKTRGGIWREVIDLLARLDGIDFRQTAPVRQGTPFIYPYGDEWLASERVLTQPLPGIKPTMIARAGGLDQGNIILNLADAEQRGLSESILFLAGSAINSIKNAAGKPDPKLGAEAMQQALELHRSGELREVPVDEHLAALVRLAKEKKFKTLHEALRQRYPEQAI